MNNPYPFLHKSEQCCTKESDCYETHECCQPLTIQVLKEIIHQLPDDFIIVYDRSEIRDDSMINIYHHHFELDHKEKRLILNGW